GRSVSQFMNYFKIPAADVVVIFDDIDVPRGKVKARIDGGHGGHNGVRSIIEETGQSAFHRIKIGLGRPEGDVDVSDWVLGEMADEELLALQEQAFGEVMERIRNIFQASKAPA